MGIFSVANLDRLKPPARDPRKATRCGAFLTLLGVPGALAVACFFIVRAELASPVITESTTKYIQADGPHYMPVTCRAPNGCLAIATYAEQPDAASMCKSMDRWRALRYGETALMPFCYSPGLRDGVYVIWNRYPQRVLNGTTNTNIPPELLWPPYYGTDGLRLKDDEGKMFFPFGASTVYRGLKEASLSADSKGAGAARECPTAIKALVQTMDREAEATSLCNAHLHNMVQGDSGRSTQRDAAGGMLMSSANIRGRQRQRRLQGETTHNVAMTTMTHLTHAHLRTPAPTPAPAGGSGLRVNTNSNALSTTNTLSTASGNSVLSNTNLALLGSSGTGGDTKSNGQLSSNLGRLSSGIKINTNTNTNTGNTEGDDGQGNDGNGNQGNGNGQPKRGSMSGNNKPIFDGLGNANWFSPENMRDNYDNVDGRKPDGHGSGVDPETMVGLRDLPPEEITRICHAINTRTTAIPHGTSLVTMDHQTFSKFSCGGDGGLFPERTDDDGTGEATRTDSLASFSPVNVDSAPVASPERWLKQMPKSGAVWPMLLQREIIRTNPPFGLGTGAAAWPRDASRYPEGKTNVQYFRKNVVHAHLKLMPIATHTLFERKEVFALVLAALGGFFALILAGGRMLALLWLHCTRAAPKKGEHNEGEGEDGGAVVAGAKRVSGARMRRKCNTSAVELLAVDPGSVSTRSVPMVSMSENPMLRRAAGTTAASAV